MATLHRQYATLRKLHQRRATHKSHGAFISSCLRNHVIPKGLKIKTSPSTPKVIMLQCTLQNKWRAILNRTSCMLLKLLKRYHQDVTTTLTKEINNPETRLRENLEGIQENIRRLTTTYDQRKTKKLSKLIKNKPRRTIRHCRKKRSQRNNTERENINMNTVINISNVPLSDSEISLLSRGLSFCPKPSRINKFQIKEDVQQFSRWLRLREYFHNSDETTNETLNPFKRKSKWATPNQQGTGP